MTKDTKNGSKLYFKILKTWKNRESTRINSIPFPFLRTSFPIPFSYPEPFLRAERRGALAKSIIGYHENMVRKQYPVLELANQMPVRIWIWPEPLVAPRVRRALGTIMFPFLMAKSQSQQPKSHFPSLKIDQSQFPFYPFRTLFHDHGVKSIPLELKRPYGKKKTRSNLLF